MELERFGKQAPGAEIPRVPRDFLAFGPGFEVFGALLTDFWRDCGRVELDFGNFRALVLNIDLDFCDFQHL